MVGSQIATPRMVPMQLRTPKQVPLKSSVLDSVVVPLAAVRTEKPVTPLRDGKSASCSRNPALLGGIIGGIIALVFIMVAVHPPRHDVAEDNSKLREEVLKRNRENRVLQSLLDELKRREKARSSEDPILIKLEELEGKLHRSEVQFRQSQPEQLTKLVRAPHPGDLVHASHDFSFGGTLVIKKDSPGVIIKYNDRSRGGWFVEFVGVFGASRPIGITAKTDDLYLA